MYLLSNCTGGLDVDFVGVFTKLKLVGLAKASLFAQFGSGSSFPLTCAYTTRL